MIIQAAVTCSNLKKSIQVSQKNHLQFLVTPIPAQPLMLWP